MILEDQLREKSSEGLHVVEALLYVVVGALLAVAAAGGVIRAGVLPWGAAMANTRTDYALQVLDQLLLVLMIVELLYTVRIVGPLGHWSWSRF